jgi:uroporphyrin-III C-methyltransferase / precorrin-2 dehydrogenase / sirohydrochlorin ferrochelatase
MDYLPIFLKIAGRKALVVGGGLVAARKVAWLREAGARVTIVAPKVTAALDDLARAATIEWRAREFMAADLRGQALVIAATNDAALNRRIHLLANDANLPVNVVDCPELCSFIVPSIVDRSPVVIAISSGGAAPVLARLLRARLEALLPQALGRLARLAAGFRKRVKLRLPDAAARRRFWEGVFADSMTERLTGGGDGERALTGLLDDAAAERARPGMVYLVGAGPGDPDLLTLRALRLLQQADVVLHDKLVAPEILDLVRRDAERIDVGRRAGNHAHTQDDTNALMVELANAGRQVVRLKAGDPFIFGRGGEELEYLAAHGVAFQIVPGITAALGCAAYAGIPLTHRDHAQSCLFVTARSAGGELDLDFPALVRPHQTVVVYMGLRALPGLVAGLREHGLDAATQIAVIENGTRGSQRVLTSTLDAVAATAQASSMTGPALIVIGSVVGLHDRLAWFAGAAREADPTAVEALAAAAE